MAMIFIVLQLPVQAASDSSSRQAFGLIVNASIGGKLSETDFACQWNSALRRFNPSEDYADLSCKLVDSVR